jgi:hypothetical protein
MNICEALFCNASTKQYINETIKHFLIEIS